MQFTLEQQAAINTIDRNVIVTAGAGSGKTSVLVTRFMHLLEQNPDWNLLNIVAITFTEKAAREMRERIRHAIRAKISSADISEQERQRWQSLENQLDSARISTIHGLCSRILRANPVEASLDPRFEVLDEVDAATLQDDVIEFAMGTAVDSGETWTELLPLYEVRNVRRILKGFIGLGWLDDVLQEDFDGAALWSRWASLQQEINEQAMLDVLNDRDFLDALNAIQGPFPAGDKLSDICRGVEQQCATLNGGNLDEAVAAINKLASEIKVNVGSKDSWGGKDILDAVKADLKRVREKAQDVQKRLYPPLTDVDEVALEYCGYWRDAILSVRQMYQQTKADRQALDFDDLEQKTMQLLRDYRAVSERYNHPEYGEFKHIMVDEFQDTNDAQRQIVYALCGIDAYSAQPGKLFVVGDPKQSIYAFRGADVSVFQRVREEIIAASGERVNLSRSFRTHDRLVQSFNRIFEAIMRRENDLARDYSVEFEAMDAHRPTEFLDLPPVHMIVIRKPEDVEMDTAERRRWEAIEIGRHIKNMVDNEMPVYNKREGIYRPVTYDDVAILFRAMTNVNLYEDAFQQMGIPYLTVAGRGYFDQQEIYDLRNLLRALHNPADDLALASALRSPLFNFSDDLLLALRLRTNKQADRYPMSLWTALFWQNEPLPHWVDLPAGELEKIAFARDVLDVMHAMAGRVTIGELLNQALDLTGFEATLISLENGIRRRANVLKFLDVARDSQRVSLGSFNAYLADLVAAQAREGEAPLEPEGTVTLMTVHKSKGLEFPVIVLADASYSGRNITDPVMLTAEFGIAPNTPAMEEEKPFIYELSRQFRADQEYAESKRLFYVGATRAQDSLIISGQQNSRWKGSWLYWLLEELEIDDTWPDVSIHEPVEIPDAILRETVSMSGWDMLDAVDVTPANPVNVAPLLETTPQYIPPIRHVSASHLEILGRVKDDGSVLRPEDFRRRVLRGAPPPIKPIVYDVDPTDIPPYITGNIVHRAIQVRLKREHDVDEILRGYAWDEGLTREDSIEEAVHQARLLLEHYWGSEIHQWLLEADTIRQEIEFVFRKVDYLIHGVIDTLIYHEGRWKVIDYKTDMTTPQFVSKAARRYLYQMGAYAEAVYEMMGEIPEVHLYFLRPQVRYPIPESDWRQAIDTLNFEIDELLMERTHG